MDSLTQVLFGGVLAAAGFRKSLGRRAVAAGGLIATLPDFDVFSGLLGQQGVVDGWQYHRAVSHSFPATLVYGAAIGWLIWKAGRLRRQAAPQPLPAEPDRRSAWMWLGALCAVTHPLLDLFTAYGTQLLAPFSTVRFAIPAMPIIDPVYSLPLLVIFLFALVSRRLAATAQRAAQWALVYVFLYTTMAWGIGLHLEQRARDELRGQSASAAPAHAPARITAYPVIFQPWWRRVVVDLPDEILIGFVSPFAEAPIAWQRFPRLQAPEAVQASHEARVFRWFSDAHVHWSLKSGTPTIVEARDYRYGMPGDSILGFWGLRFRLDAEGRVTGAVERLSERPPFTRAGLAEIWNGVLGR